MRQVHVYDHPDRCVIGTTGPPGQRAFFLQVRLGRRVHCLLLEKEQARILAERVDALLDEMVERGEVSAASVSPDAVVADDEPLDPPIEEDFRVGAIGLGWNSNTDVAIVELHRVTEDDTDVPDLEDDAAEGPETVRIRLGGAAARGFARRALAVVAAGRPVCPFCQLPLDPEGHICPRANGYRR